MPSQNYSWLTSISVKGAAGANSEEMFPKNLQNSLIFVTFVDSAQAGQFCAKFCVCRIAEFRCP